MPSIFDIAPPEIVTEPVELVRPGGTFAFKVRGLTMREMTALLRRFPHLDKTARQAASGNLARIEDVGDIDGLMEEMAEMWPSVITTGAVDLEGATEELIKERFSENERQTIATRIMELTNPQAGGRVGPLAERALSGGTGAESGKVEDTSSS